MTSPTLVWCEIPVTDLDRASAFYTSVYGLTVTRDDSGPMPMLFLGDMDAGPAGHLYPGTPATAGSGNTVHLALAPGDTLEQAQDRVRESGGQTPGPTIEKPFGRWSYALDPDGNSIGLFEAAS